MRHAILVPVEGPIQYLDIPEDQEYDTLVQMVGGFIESIPIPAFVKGGEFCSAYINDEGKLEGRPANMKATDFFVPGVGLFYGDYIVGPMVLIGFNPETGESADDIPPAVVRRIELINEEAN